MTAPYAPATLAQVWGCSERHVRKAAEALEYDDIAKAKKRKA